MENQQLTAVYWGAFDPPTKAHLAIIEAALKEPSFKKVVIVVNNNSYKKYTLYLSERLELMRDNLNKLEPEKTVLLWQDDNHLLDHQALMQMCSGPLCALSGYDSYKEWVANSSEQERRLYEKIAVVPRGDDEPVLFDENAFLLEIDPSYRHISSSREKLFSC